MSHSCMPNSELAHHMWWFLQGPQYQTGSGKLVPYFRELMTRTTETRKIAPVTASTQTQAVCPSSHSLLLLCQTWTNGEGKCPGGGG